MTPPITSHPGHLTHYELVKPRKVEPGVGDYSSEDKVKAIGRQLVANHAHDMVMVIHKADVTIPTAGWMQGIVLVVLVCERVEVYRMQTPARMGTDAEGVEEITNPKHGCLIPNMIKGHTSGGRSR